jgi:hypothetical protein
MELDDRIVSLARRRLAAASSGGLPANRMQKSLIVELCSSPDEVKRDCTRCKPTSSSTTASSAASARPGRSRAGIPSHVSASLTEALRPTDLEGRERMSGNIYRCGRTRTRQ